MANNTPNSMLIAVVAIIAIIILAFFAFRFLPQNASDNGVLPDVNVDVNDTTPGY